MSDILYRKRINWWILLLLTLGLLLVPAIPVRASSAPPTTESATIVPAIQSAGLEPLNPDYYHEAGHIWINPDGWISSEVRMEGSEVIVGDFDLNKLSKTLKDMLDHAHFRFRPTNDPNDINGNIQITLRTNSFTTAELYGEIILDLLNQYTIVTWEHTGTWGWDDWRGDQWTQLTTVDYRATIYWPWFMDVLNDAIPRDYGGLAETVDISNADELWFWAWPGHEGDRIWHGIGANWGRNAADYLSGSFSFSAKELLHVTSLQKATHDDSLWLMWELPNINNLATTPNYNSSGNWNVYTEYHPNEEEPWNTHNNYGVWMDLYSSVSDFKVSFDYTFTPWALQNVEQFQAMVNPYGYLWQRAQFRTHSLVDLSGIAGIDEVHWVNFWMEPNRASLPSNARNDFGYHNTFGLDIAFKNDTTSAERNATALAIAAAYETVLGGSFNHNNTWIEWWSWGSGGADLYRVGYYGDENDVTKSTMESVLQSSSFYTDSPNLQQYGLDGWTSYWENWNYRYRLGGFWSKEANIDWNPLVPWIEPPTGKIFAEDVAGTYNLTATDLWNWTTIEKSPNFDRLEVRFIVPIYWDNDAWDTTTDPDRNNGFGYTIGKWDWTAFPSLRFAETNLEVYTEEPWIKDNQGNNISRLNEFELSFDYEFSAETIDLGAPGSDLGVFAEDQPGDWGHWPWESEWADWTWNETQEIVINAWDDPWHGDGWHFEGYYWRSVPGERAPRFGVSNIDNVEIDLFFADLPVDDPAFHRSLATSYNSSIDRWRATWDTDNGQFADGEWAIITRVNDTLGHPSDRSDHVVVDNYPDGDPAFKAPNITITPLAGYEGSWSYGGKDAWNVSGRVRVQINVSDAQKVFAAVFTADFGGWILDADYEVYNESPTLFVYEFEWESRNEIEDSMHLITVKAWDIDGHTTDVTLWWLIDNRKVGEPPMLDIISPSSGENITGLYSLRVNVTDDWTLPEDLNVEVSVDDREPLVLGYNESSTFFELLWNSATVVDGDHTLTFKATDWDENEHTIMEAIDIITTNGIESLEGDPPEWIDFTGTSDQGQLVNHSQQEMVSGDYDSHSGNIFFEIFVMDDLGIDSVKIAIYKVPAEAIDPLSQTIDDAVVKQNRLSNYPQAMTDEGETSEGYGRYTHEWDSRDEADNLWVVDVTIADIDDPQNIVSVWLPVFTDNFEDQEPEVGVPGFEALGILLGLGTIIALRAWRKNSRV
ncbi:MAG: hypothetical protein ACE5OZ_12415 [Candidatus Heimdallarchaeota archaeon]